MHPCTLLSKLDQGSQREALRPPRPACCSQQPGAPPPAPSLSTTRSVTSFLYFPFQCICCLFVLFIEIFLTSSVTATWLCILPPPPSSALNNKDASSPGLPSVLCSASTSQLRGSSHKNDCHFTLKGTRNDVRHLMPHTSERFLETSISVWLRVFTGPAWANRWGWPQPLPGGPLLSPTPSLRARDDAPRPFPLPQTTLAARVPSLLPRVSSSQCQLLEASPTTLPRRGSWVPGRTFKLLLPTSPHGSLSVPSTSSPAPACAAV